MEQDVWIQFAANANDQTIGRFINLVQKLYNEGKSNFHIMLSTSGGSVMHGMTAYNFLRSLPIKVTTFNMSRVDSIGGIMFLSGEERFAVPNSAFLIHGVASGIPPSTTMQFIDEKDLKEKLGSISKDRKNIAKVYIDRIKIKPEEIDKLMIEGATLNTEEATKYGLIKGVRMPQIQEGAQVFSITDVA